MIKDFQNSRGAQPIHSLFGAQMQRAVHFLQIVDCSKDPRHRQGRMKLLVSDRKHPVGDIVYRCFSLAFNCKHISFARAGLNLGRHGYVVNVNAIIAATDPGKCDGPLLGASGRDIGLRTSTIRSMPEHETPNTTWTKNSVDVSLGWPLWIDLCDAEVDHCCVLRHGAGQTPSIASNILISPRWNELRYDVIHLSKDHVYVCVTYSDDYGIPDIHEWALLPHG